MTVDSQPASEDLGNASPWWTQSSVLRLGWLLTAILAVAMVVAADYRLHDPDSKLYTALSSELAVRPLFEWCAPTWNGHWDRTDLFREHPPLLLWFGALAYRAGVPAAQALMAINFGAVFASLILLCHIGRRLGGVGSARLAVGLWMVSPFFVHYLVRANEENPLAAALLLAVFACVAVDGVGRAGALWSIALVLAVGVKGPAGLSLLAVGVAHWALWELRDPLIPG